GAGTVAQDFRHSAHRLTWTRATGRVAVQQVWGWAVQAFSAAGVRPAWGTLITRDWFRQYFAGQDRGAALEPFNGSEPCRAGRQVFVHSRSSLRGTNPLWLPRAGEAALQLVAAGRWQPIDQAVRAFGRDLVQHQRRPAAQFLTPPLKAL